MSQKIANIALVVSLIAPTLIHAQQPAHPISIPAGTTIDVELLSEISTKQAVGTRFEAKLKESLLVGGHLVAPAGTPVYGVITRSEGGQKFSKQSLATTMKEIRINGHLLPIVTDTAGVEGKSGGGLKKIGKGTLRGAVIGGGPAGAVVGTAVGGVQTAAGKGKQISLPAGRIIEVHLLTAVHAP